MSVSPRARRILLALVILVIAGEPFLFAGSFAGDAQVHLVFAESASHGRFFEFNPGERVSGETSIGYMLLGAALFRAMPARWVPVALKLIGLAAWYFFCWLVYRVAVRVLSDPKDPDRFWPAVAAVTAALIPGSVYNANVGMENGLFAAVVWLWLDLACQWNVFERGRLPPPAREVGLGALLGLSCWLRPEGLLVATVAFAFRSLIVRPPRYHWLIGPVLTAMIATGCLAFQYAFTGDVVATSILSRRVLAMRNEISLGPLAVDPAFAERLVLYAPLTLLFFVGLRTDRQQSQGPTRYLLWLLATSFAFYTLFGAPQLARYIISVSPILPIVGATGARRWWSTTEGRRRTVVILAGICLLAIDAGETLYRRGHFSQHLLAAAMSAPSLRQQQTDDLLEDLGTAPRSPIVLACESVQQRYELDNRIVVRSLDGRTDRILPSYVRGGRVDHVAYLKHIRADVLAGPIDYDRGAAPGQLSGLDELPPGGTVERRGLTFRRLRSHGFALSEARKTTSAAGM